MIKLKINFITDNKIKTEDVFENFSSDKEMLDFSNLFN